MPPDAGTILAVPLSNLPDLDRYDGIGETIAAQTVPGARHAVGGKNPLPNQVFTVFRECALAHYTADPLLILADAKTVTHTVSTSGMRV